MRFHDPKYFNDFCAHPLHLFSLVGIFYPPNWQCPSCHDAYLVAGDPHDVGFRLMSDVARRCLARCCEAAVALTLSR